MFEELDLRISELVKDAKHTLTSVRSLTCPENCLRTIVGCPKQT